jgi:hypothetical protein
VSALCWGSGLRAGVLAPTDVVRWGTTVVLEAPLSPEADEGEHDDRTAVGADHGDGADDVVELTGDDDRDAEPEVRHDVDGGDDGGAFVPGDDRHDQAECRGEGGTEADSCDGLPHEHGGEVAGDGTAGDPEGADGGCGDADGHRPPRSDGCERQPGEHGRGRCDEAGGAVEEAAVAVEHAVHDARGEAAGEPGEHPDGSHHGCGREDLGASRGRHGHVRCERAQGARSAADRLAGGRHRGTADDGEGTQRDEDDRVGRRCELDGKAREQRPDGETPGEGDAAEDRAEPPVVVRSVFDECCGERGRRCAAGDALHDAAGDDPSEAGGGEEQQVRGELDDEGGDQHGSSPDVIGQ